MIFFESRPPRECCGVFGFGSGEKLSLRSMLLREKRRRRRSAFGGFEVRNVFEK